MSNFNVKTTHKTYSRKTKLTSMLGAFWFKTSASFDPVSRLLRVRERAVEFAFAATKTKCVADFMNYLVLLQAQDVLSTGNEVKATLKGLPVPDPVFSALSAYLLSDAPCRIRLAAVNILTAKTGLTSEGVNGDIVLPYIIGDGTHVEALRTAAAGVARQVEALDTRLVPAPVPWDDLESWLGEGPRRLEMFIRVMASCLSDAHGEENPKNAKTQWSTKRLSAMLTDFLAAYYDKMDQVKPTLLNLARKSLFDQCSALADLPRGVYSIYAPSGLGKTFTYMNAALCHGVAQDQDRLIVATPFKAVTGQVADNAREMVGREIGGVLEHHSSVDDTRFPEIKEWRIEAKGNWDAPFIVTTHGQLLRSMMASKLSSYRKVHNIANSVIILDESHLMNAHYIVPIVDALQEAVDSFRATVIIVTATPTPLDGSLTGVFHGFRDVHHLVTDPAPLLAEADRVTFKIEKEPWAWEKVAEEMQKGEQSFCIVNTIRQANELSKILSPDGNFHLNGDTSGDRCVFNMTSEKCTQHREDTLNEIHSRLLAGKLTFVVGTTSIECGVNLDFRVGFRVAASVASIIQTAGRVNREKLRSKEESTLTVFLPENLDYAPGQKAEAVLSQRILKSYSEEDGTCDLYNPEIIELYFKELWSTLGPKLDLNGIQSSRASHDFRATDEHFHLVEMDHIAVVAYYYDPEAVDAILKEIPEGNHVSEEIRLRLRPYSVDLPDYKFRRGLDMGAITQKVPGLFICDNKYSQFLGLDTVPFGTKPKGRDEVE